MVLIAVTFVIIGTNNLTVIPIAAMVANKYVYTDANSCWCPEQPPKRLLAKIWLNMVRYRLYRNSSLARACLFPFGAPVIGYSGTQGLI